MPQTTLDRTTPVDFTITVVLEPQDYQSRANAELRRIAKSAKIKGFRPGKVPTSYLRQVYGRGAMTEAISKMIDEELNKLINEQELKIFAQIYPVSEPDFQQLGPDLNETLTFIYEGGLLPQIETVNTSGLKAVRPKTIRSSDAEIDKRLKDASKGMTVLVERDTVETEQDIATLVLSDPELDARYYGEKAAAHSAEPTIGNDAKDGADADSAEHSAAPAASAAQADNADLDSGEGDTASAKTHSADTEEDEDALSNATEDEDPRLNYSLCPADLKEKSRYNLIDRAVGTQIVLSLEDIEEEAHEEFEDVLKGEETATFTIAKVEREDTLELDDDTVSQLFSDYRNITSVDEARTAIARGVAESSQSNLDVFVLDEIIDKLISDNEVEAPLKAIKAYLEKAMLEARETAAKKEESIDLEESLTEADRQAVARRLKWMAIRTALLEEYNIQIEKTDINEAIEANYHDTMTGIGIDPERFREQLFSTFRTNFAKNKEKMMEVIDDILSQKLLRHLDDSGILGERQYLSETEFSEIVGAYDEQVERQLEELRSQPMG